MAKNNLHFDDYNRIGSVHKRLHPGLYDRYTDEQVGVVAIEQGHFSPDKYLAAKTTGADMVAEILNLDNKPSWFEGLFQVGREERKNRILAQRGQQASAVIEFQKKKIESLQLDFELQHLPEMLAAAEFIRELQMEFQVHVMEDQRKELVHKDILRTAAAKAELTIEGHISEKLAEAASKRKLEEQKEELKAAFEDHERRERLKASIEKEVYRDKVDALKTLGRGEDVNRSDKESELDGWLSKRDELVSGKGKMSTSLRAERLLRAEQNILRLKAELDGLEENTPKRGAKDSGEESGGSNSTPEPGQPPPEKMGGGQKPLSSKGHRTIQ